MTAPPEKRSEILEKTKERAAELVHLRDKFIARRIRDTLPKKGNGIIFMGRHHNVPAELENLKDEKGEKKLVIMGCYGIGVNRIMASLIETSNDKDGIIWPASIAPYSAIILALNMEDKKVKELAEEA